MESVRRASAEAIKQRKTRNTKAECISELIVLATALGVQLNFHKTKRSSYAKKLYIADEVHYRQIYLPAQILEMAVAFECVLRRLWGAAKRHGQSEMELTWDAYTREHGSDGMDQYIRSKVSIVTDDKKLMACNSLWSDSACRLAEQYPSTSKNEEYLKKRKTRNREAAFSSFLSYILLREGYRLTCQVSAQKVASKTLNFYLWKRYVLPNGRACSLDDLRPITTKLRNHLKAQFLTNQFVALSRESLLALAISGDQLAALNLVPSPQQHPAPLASSHPNTPTKRDFPTGGVLHYLGF